MTRGLKKTIDRFRNSLATGAMSDAALLKKFISEGDEDSFTALVRKHGSMVLGVCRRVLRDAHDSDDAFQATFLVLAKKALSVVNRQAIGSWLYTVAFRTALEARARNARRKQRESQVEHMPHPEVSPTEPNDWQPVLD